VHIERYKNELLKIEESWGKKARNMNYKCNYIYITGTDTNLKKYLSNIDPTQNIGYTELPFLLIFFCLGKIYLKSI
jgi:hypothetical protein